MLALLTLESALLLHDPEDLAGDSSVCRCTLVQATDGWCAKCGVGYYASQRIGSWRLFEVLDIDGHEVDADRTACATCRAAIRGGGYCEACNMGYLSGRGFFSRLCYHLARGRTVPPSATQSACCPASGEWCAACRSGRVGNRVFLDSTDFEAAHESHRVLTSALREARRCESCAIAMIADARCHQCRLQYRHGRRVYDAPQSIPSSAPDR
jgi:hypothetical protein